MTYSTHPGGSRLSARLFEATGNTTYQLAAQLSAWFIQSHLYDGTVIIDTFDLSNCTANLAQETYNSGLVIEGLSVYVNQTNNATMRSLWVHIPSNQCTILMEDIVSQLE